MTCVFCKTIGRIQRFHGNITLGNVFDIPNLHPTMQFLQMIDFTTNPDRVFAGKQNTDVKQLTPSALWGSFSDYRPTCGSKTAVPIKTTSREKEHLFRTPSSVRWEAKSPGGGTMIVPHITPGTWSRTFLGRWRNIVTQLQNPADQQGGEVCRGNLYENFKRSLYHESEESEMKTRSSRTIRKETTRTDRQAAYSPGENTI